MSGVSLVQECVFMKVQSGSIFSSGKNFSTRREEFWVIFWVIPVLACTTWFLFWNPCVPLSVWNLPIVVQFHMKQSAGLWNHSSTVVSADSHLIFMVAGHWCISKKISLCSNGIDKVAENRALASNSEVCVHHTWPTTLPETQVCVHHHTWLPYLFEKHVSLNLALALIKNIMRTDVKPSLYSWNFPVFIRMDIGL